MLKAIKGVLNCSLVYCSCINKIESTVILLTHASLLSCQRVAWIERYLPFVAEVQLLQVLNNKKKCSVLISVNDYSKEG